MAKTLYVAEGRVDCPRRGDIDVDLCVCCPDLSDTRDDQGEIVIKCTGRSRSTVAHLVFGSSSPHREWHDPAAVHTSAGTRERRFDDLGG